MRRKFLFLNSLKPSHLALRKFNLSAAVRSHNKLIMMMLFDIADSLVYSIPLPYHRVVVIIDLLFSLCTLQLYIK